LIARILAWIEEYSKLEKQLADKEATAAKSEDYLECGKLQDTLKSIDTLEGFDEWFIYNSTKALNKKPKDDQARKEARQKAKEEWNHTSNGGQSEGDTSLPVMNSHLIFKPNAIRDIRFPRTISDKQIKQIWAGVPVGKRMTIKCVMIG
jgi:hypothetical protein